MQGNTHVLRACSLIRIKGLLRRGGVTAGRAATRLILCDSQLDCNFYTDFALSYERIRQAPVFLWQPIFKI